MLLRKFEKGYTLTEVLVVVAILALLAGIAVPSYTEHVRKARRAEAKATLMKNVGEMEKVKDYSTVSTIPIATSPAGATGVAIDYNVSFASTSTATTYTLQAVPANKMASDACGTFTINNFGTRTISGTATMAECWNK